MFCGSALPGNGDCTQVVSNGKSRQPGLQYRATAAGDALRLEICSSTICIKNGTSLHGREHVRSELRESPDQEQQEQDDMRSGLIIRYFLAEPHNPPARLHPH